MGPEPSTGQKLYSGRQVPRLKGAMRREATMGIVHTLTDAEVTDALTRAGLAGSTRFSTVTMSQSVDCGAKRIKNTRTFSPAKSALTWRRTLRFALHWTGHARHPQL